VNLSAFYMGKNVVTKGEWDTVRLWGQGHGYTDIAVGGGKGINHPVVEVKWWHVVKWCNAWSEQEGRTPVYYTDAGLAAVYKTGDVTVYANWAANGYRLPTEAGESGARRVEREAFSVGRYDHA
jgi:formylglycine-generating enzyme required for sulfatase activity